MKVKTAIAAMIGLCVPVFWGFLALLFMHARFSPATERVWIAARWITCPLWNTPLSNTQPSGERGNVWAGCVWVLADRELETEA